MPTDALRFASRLNIRQFHEQVQAAVEHGVTMDEVEQALANPRRQGHSASSGLPYTMGITNARRWLVVIYERVDAITICPVTAYDLDD